MKGFAHYVLLENTRIGIEALTVIVILALVALFIGLRLYSVLGERTGHEQQPILKPADPEAVVGQQVNRPSVVQPSSTDAGDLAYLPTAGPGVRALLAADPNFDVARFLEGGKSAYRMVLESYWKGDAAGLRHGILRARDCGIADSAARLCADPCRSEGPAPLHSGRRPDGQGPH